MSRFFRRKTGAAKVSTKQTAPRTLDLIQKDYSELLAKAAQSQYLVYVHGKDLEQINQALVSVNQEAAARQVLDKEATKGESDVQS